MGPGILKAVAQVFPHTPDFICHYHFLRDIGNDLFGKDYDLIRKRLRKHGITSKLHYRARRLKPVIDDNSALMDAFHSDVQNEKLSYASLVAVHFPDGTSGNSHLFNVP
jgi:hypothetical protein